MGLRINTNTQSIQAQASLNKVRQKQESSLAKMASGQRINKAADDAAGSLHFTKPAIPRHPSEGCPAASTQDSFVPTSQGRESA